MKTKNKALLLALCAVSLVTASVLGTMAYLTDDKMVTNTFTVGSVAITMDETDVDEAGKPIEGADPVQANTYKLVPGQEYTKDPTIHVDSKSEDCFLFVKVDNKIANIEADGSKVADQMAANGWTKVDGQTNVYVKMNGSALQTVKGGEDVKNYEGETITVTAYAVQKAGFENETPADIWTATFGKA